jgi:hypothetical protein
VAWALTEKMSVRVDSNRDQVLSFLHMELTLASGRIQEVGGYQKGVATWFFTLYTAFVGTFIFADNEKIACIRQRLDGLVLVIPALIFLVGFALYLLYLKYEVYLRRYKAHVGQLELAIHDVLGRPQASLRRYKITYYSDLPGHAKRFKPIIVWDATLVIPLGLSFVMNTGLPLFAVMALQEATRHDGIVLPSLFVASLLVHFVVAWCLVAREYREGE